MTKLFKKWKPALRGDSVNAEFMAEMEELETKLTELRQNRRPLIGVGYLFEIDRMSR